MSRSDSERLKNGLNVRRTRDYARFDAEGRILFKNYPDDWEKYTLAFPVTRMPHVTGAGLMRRYVQVLQYSVKLD